MAGLSLTGIWLGMGVGEHLFECERDRKETKNDELVD